MLITAGTDLKEFQRFEQRPFVRERNKLIKGLCSKRWNSSRSVTAVINLLNFLHFE